MHRFSRAVESMPISRLQRSRSDSLRSRKVQSPSCSVAVAADQSPQSQRCCAIACDAVACSAPCSSLPRWNRLHRSAVVVATDQSPRCSHSQQRSAVSLAAALRPRCSEASLHCSPRCSHSHTLSSVAAMLSRGNGAAPRVAHLHVQHRSPSVPTRLDSTRTTQRLDWDAPAVVAPGRAAL